MRGKKLLVTLLLGAGLCFVPALGYGEVQEWMLESKASYMELSLLESRVSYMMSNPTNFLNINFYYDQRGAIGEIYGLSENIDTKGKILVVIRDTRDVFFYKSRIALLDLFKRQLEVIYSFIQPKATDMDTDVVAKLVSKDEIPVGYFYQGEYHLWGE